jgi:4-amino-4-deoxy-L-arabinose transferase-like glycosyltransferase
MTSAATVPSGAGELARERARALPSWWPLAALVALAAALRLSTLDLQSLWYDEAFTPVHVLRPSLGATLHAIVHTENTPPLWYVLEWAVTRALGTGAVALRLLSALAGVALVAVAWAIAHALAGRRAAIAAAALVAVNPLFVWYSQEARAYSLFALCSALALLFCLRAYPARPAHLDAPDGLRGALSSGSTWPHHAFALASAPHSTLERPSRTSLSGYALSAARAPTPARLAAFAVSASLALLTHYFAVFLVAPMALWLLVRDRRRAVLLACGAVAAVGVALLPLALAQGGHGSQWIGRWPLTHRLQAIPQYYLTGYSGAPLGHAIELLVALPILAGALLALWRVLEPAEERSALLMLALTACGVLLPLALVAFGADYLAPRNLLAAMVPLTALLAILFTARRTGLTGPLLAGITALAFLIVTIDINFSPRLQRGDWRGVADVLRGGIPNRVLTTVELGAAPLQYYLPGLHNLARGASVTVREIDETGYVPLRLSAGSPPASGFRLLSRSDINGLIVYRFVSPVARPVSEATLRRRVITLAHPEVLVRPVTKPSSPHEKI